MTRHRWLYLPLFIVIALLSALAPVPGKVMAFGDEWLAYTAGTWGFDSSSSLTRWQEVRYQGQQRITTGWLNWFGGNGIRLYNTSTGSGFPLAFDSECTPCYRPR